MQFAGQATNPRLAYDALAGVLDYDESLMGRATGQVDDPGTRDLESHEDPDFELIFGIEIPFSKGVALFYFAHGVRQTDDEFEADEDAMIAILTRLPSGQSGSLTSSKDGGEPIQIEVQGVTLQGTRYEEMESDVSVRFPMGTESVSGPGVSVVVLHDVAEDPDDPKSKLFDVVLILQRPVEGGAMVTDDDVRAFLAPFHIGPDR